VVGGATTMACVDADWSRFAVDLPSLRSWMPDLEPVSSEADVSTVEGAVAEILRCTGDTLGTERVEASPSQMGMDSILAVQLSDQLQRSLGVPVPAAGILGAESLEAFLDLALRPLDLERQEKGAPEPAAVVSAEPPNPWLLPLQQPEGARIKLLCFPFAGVGASVYRGWTFDGPIEAHGVELPARGALREEALTMEMDDLVARLRQALLPELDGPFAFFGHCMGGLVAFELARALSRDGKTPEHLFISACPPPDRYAVACFDPLTLRYVSDPPPGYDGLQRMQDLAPARFTEVLRFLDFAPARVVIEDADMMRRALPVAQSDFGLCASYAWKEASPLAMPITTFVGREDPFFDMELPGGVRFAIDEWQRQTTGAFDSFERDGDHYYLMEDGAYLRGLVSHRLVGVAEPAVAG
jgi:epothilone polyketide synthase C